MRKDRVLIWLSGTFAFLLTLGVFAFLWGCSPRTSEAARSGEERRKNILVAGVDDAGENTDMLMLCSQNLDSGDLKILQIPRDTLYRIENGSGKINRVYRSVASKHGKEKAAELLAKELSVALGVPIEAYLVFGGNTVKEFVDLIGGVPVNVPVPIGYSDPKTGKKHTIPEGEQILNGEEAMAFVRHRESYAEGDLGRLDAQMSFLCGVAESLPRLKKWDRLLGVYQKILPNLLTNLREKDIIEIMMAYFKSRSSVSVSFLRLPGEATYTDGAWYYVLHRSATEKMLTDCFGVHGTFDEAERFTNPAWEAVRNIYTYPVSDYRVFTSADVREGRILQKKDVN